MRVTLSQHSDRMPGYGQRQFSAPKCAHILIPFFCVQTCKGVWGVCTSLLACIAYSVCMRGFFFSFFYIASLFAKNMSVILLISKICEFLWEKREKFHSVPLKFFMLYISVLHIGFLCVWNMYCDLIWLDIRSYSLFTSSYSLLTSKR